MISRTIEHVLAKRLFKGKAILIFGARQTGKSTLVENLLRNQDQESIVLNGDDADVRELLSDTTSTKLKAIIGNKKIILIDEAQRIRNVGLTLKLITDQIKDFQPIATGSSAFELSSQVNEPLTGRKYEFMLYPVSFQEMVNYHGLLTEKRLIEHRMQFGYYPEIVTNPGEEKERLKLLACSYLYKDLLMLEQIKKPALLEKLLNALALQLGSEVNYNELGQLIGSDRKTVEKYIDLLKKAFVIFELPAFSRNLRNEIKKGKKIYFYDCGIRNAVINNFKPLSSRADTGALWENFVIAERIKFLNNNEKEAKHFFWRTTQQQEIDLIEESEEGLKAFEIKWNKNAKARIPLTFKENYQKADIRIVSPENIEEIIMPT
jgi:predicted AAA+ superfamily ATPase